MASGSSSAPRYPIFRTSIEKLFGNWQALQLAVENGQGGGYGKEIAIWMRQAVEDYFYQNDDLDGDEVSEFIEELMNKELDTIVDDNSLEALGENLVQHFRLAVSGNHLELNALFQKIDEEASKPKPKVTRQEGNDDSDSSEGDEEMEVDETSASQNPDGNSEQAGPSHHRAGRNFVTEPDDDGWVTVTKSKKH